MCADRTGEGAEATAAGIRVQGGSAESAVCDAANAADVAALATSAKQKFPAARYRGHNAGTEHPQDHPRLHRGGSRPRHHPQYQGTVWFFQNFGRIMVDQQGGSLIACSSVRAVTIEPGLAVYGSTKAAIGLLVKGFASEVGRFGVRVNAIAPSIVETTLTAPQAAA